jgi:hypothetical protein
MQLNFHLSREPLSLLVEYLASIRPIIFMAIEIELAIVASIAGQGLVVLVQLAGREDRGRDRQNSFSSLVHWRIIQLRFLFA